MARNSADMRRRGDVEMRRIKAPRKSKTGLMIDRYM